MTHPNVRHRPVTLHRRHREPVILNVYDLTWLNEYATPLGLGIFHSGVQVYGTEFAYGGHPYNFSGIFSIAPRDTEDLGEQFRFKESILIGHTEFTNRDVHRIMRELGNSYLGSRYHLMQNNCNHFACALTHLLCGKTIPKWVNRLAAMSCRVPFLQRILPKDWLTPNVINRRPTRSRTRSQGPARQ